MASLNSRYAEASTTKLIRASRADPGAFAALFDRHAMALRKWLFAQTRDVGVANELLAETFARAWRGGWRFRGEGESSGVAWLYGIARNLVRHHHRRGRVETAARRRLAMSTRASSDGELDDAAARIDAQALSPSVSAAFAELTLEQQRAIGYRVLGELSYEELAARLDCSAVTARTRVHRGLRALRCAIDKGGQP